MCAIDSNLDDAKHEYKGGHSSAWLDAFYEEYYRASGYDKEWRELHPKEAAIRNKQYEKRRIEKERADSRARGRAWRKTNVDKVRARNRNWRATHPDHAREYCRARHYDGEWREANPKEAAIRDEEYQEYLSEKRRVRNHAYYETHRERSLAQQRAYAKEHREQVQAQKRAYGKAHKKEKAEYDRIRYEANPGQAIARAFVWGKANPEKTRRYKRIWDEKNPEQHRAYYEAHPEKARASNARRRARKRDVAYENFTDIEIFERDGWCCQNCDKRVSYEGGVYSDLYPNLDHVIALARGGEHTRANTQLLCRRCNAKKGAGHDPKKLF